MERIRAFIAVEISADVRAQALKLIKELAPRTSSVRWVEPQTMHVTLAFLGEIEMLDIPQLCDAMADAVAEVPPFDLQFVGAGAFPSVDRPRTIWLGTGDGAEAMRELQRSLQDRLDAMGYRGESRQYRPHLTLGRLKGNDEQPGGELSRRLVELRDFPGGATDVNEIVLFSSVMHRSGPTYEALGEAVLAGM